MIMRHVPYSRLRAELASHMDEVCKERAPLLVTRPNRTSVVMIARDEYEALMETLHLVRSPANAKRLLQSVAEADEGNLAEPNPPRPRRRR
jgi:antitoxin YefM